MFSGNDGAFVGGSEGNGILNVGKEDASISFKGTTKAAFGNKATLSTHVIQQNDGKLGSIEGLSVKFTLSSIQPNGSLKTYTSSITDSVFMTDAAGNAAVQMLLPSGLYEVKTELLANSYYHSAEVKTILAIYNPKARKVNAEGWYQLPAGGDNFMGTKAKKVHFETEWEFDHKSGFSKGKLKLHAEPNGLKLEMKEADWVIISDNSTYVQGMATDNQGNKFTIRLMMSNEHRRVTVSLLIWKGTDTNANPDYASYGQELKGHVE
jgi:hypothetical protein